MHPGCYGCLSTASAPPAPADASWPLDKQQNKSARPLKAQRVVHLSASPPPKEVRNHQQWRSAGSEAKRRADLHQSYSRGRWEIAAHVAAGWRSVLKCGGCVGGVATQRPVSYGIWSLFEMISVIQEEATQSCCR